MLSLPLSKQNLNKSQKKVNFSEKTSFHTVVSKTEQLLVSCLTQLQTPTVKARNRQDCLTDAPTKIHCAYFLPDFPGTGNDILRRPEHPKCQMGKTQIAMECLHDHIPHVPFPAHDGAVIPPSDDHALPACSLAGTPS